MRVRAADAECAHTRAAPLSTRRIPIPQTMIQEKRAVRKIDLRIGRAEMQTCGQLAMLKREDGLN